ncbi:hypothetical protein TcasGA2_TC014049 [Tribolium castaneum]|uniref:Uncharacterized protein n=1 Tax=Tribolium castaneum TaxID=7070 RepID=D6WJX2_TRICA|nr:hypothetical protein TcasGA2_TC014049 [Tribolium castaneum]
MANLSVIESRNRLISTVNLQFKSTWNTRVTTMRRVGERRETRVIRMSSNYGLWNAVRVMDLVLEDSESFTEANISPHQIEVDIIAGFLLPISLVSKNGQGNKPLNHTRTTHYLSLISLCRKRTLSVRQNLRRNSTLNQRNRHRLEILSNNRNLMFVKTQKQKSNRKIEKSQNRHNIATISPPDQKQHQNQKFKQNKTDVNGLPDVLLFETKIQMLPKGSLLKAKPKSPFRKNDFARGASDTPTPLDAPKMGPPPTLDSAPTSQAATGGKLTWNDADDDDDADVNAKYTLFTFFMTNIPQKTQLLTQ